MSAVKVTVWSDFLSEYEEVDISVLADAIAKIPAGYLASAVFRVGYTDCLYLEISYARPETDAERQKRERDEAERAARSQRENYERERAEFVRLKAKFEGHL